MITNNSQNSNTTAYVFPYVPSQDFLSHVEYLNYFSPPECDALIAIGKNLLPQVATINIGRDIDERVRKSQVSWISHDQTDSNITWIWDKLASLVTMANTKNFHFSLVGFLEKIQFTEYTTEGSHYEWHMDYGAGSFSKRKLSLTIQLSDPGSYEGGNLELFYKLQPIVAQRTRGTAILFPSYTMHRVTPITRGERYSLVLWASGVEAYK